MFTNTKNKLTDIEMQEHAPIASYNVLKSICNVACVFRLIIEHETKLISEIIFLTITEPKLFDKIFEAQ